MFYVGIFIWVGYILLFNFVVAVDELIAVSVLYRHGDRVIGKSYPNDPYKDQSFWPVPFEELTNTGKTQQYELGKWLRQHYNSFLSQEYLAKEVIIQSSDVSRCLMSAACNLAGLYPPQGDQIWNPSLLWQPIPIHTKPCWNDGLLTIPAQCETYLKLANELLESQEFIDYENGNAALYAYLTEYTGYKISSLFDARALYDVLYIENLYNYTLPAWTIPVFPDKLEPIALKTFEFESYTPEMARLVVGQVFHKILKQFGSFISPFASEEKFQIFSAHDANVFSILHSLGIPNLQLVPYCGMVIFELRRNSEGKYFVQFLYKQDGEPELLTIEGCTPNCDYHTFKSILKPISLGTLEWNGACKPEQRTNRT
ncbi:hypothetical protein HHI36_021159 [Cryptolaemus montrouzieri]|uniref:acid phosphatase n=1 Tax=Cryptolaemus montrouzieri TaxID=559131 RepID=A0ABD2MWA4_9CUCU